MLEVRADLPRVEQRKGAGSSTAGASRCAPAQADAAAKPRGPVRERTAEGETREAVMVETEPGHFRYEFPRRRPPRPSN